MTEILAKGPRLDLIPYDDAYADLRFEWFYSPQYQAYFRSDLEYMPSPESFQNMAEKIKISGQTLLVLRDLKTGQGVGLMNYALHKPLARVYRFGVMLDQSHQGAGMCIEACILLCEVMFQKLGATKIVCDVWDRDVHLNAIILRGGYTLESSAKNEVFLNGEFSNENRYIMFREDYFRMLQGYQETGVWNRHGLV